jgi:hypothetical protein
MEAKVVEFTWLECDFAAEEQADPGEPITGKTHVGWGAACCEVQLPAEENCAGVGNRVAADEVFCALVASRSRESRMPAWGVEVGREVADRTVDTTIVIDAP